MHFASATSSNRAHKRGIPKNLKRTRLSFGIGDASVSGTGALMCYISLSIGAAGLNAFGKSPYQLARFYLGNMPKSSVVCRDQ
jgi:hypothetical protein